MTTQNKKMYYLFSIAATCPRCGRRGVWLYYFVACVAHGSLRLRATVETMFTSTLTQYTSTKGKKKSCLCLVVEKQSFY